MIDLYYAPTPNGWKISIMLEECNLPYKVIPVNLGKGDQFKPDFLKISPNNRMPAIVDHENLTDGDPLSIFESGAILMYLGEKTGKFFPQESPSKEKVLEWLFWQVGGLGPMAGQVSHFVNYAPNFPGDHSYSEKRYKDEYDRLLGVMDNVLEDKEYLDQIVKNNQVVKDWFENELRKINIKIITGSSKASIKKDIKNDLKDGKIDLLIGTHSLFQKKILFLIS